MAQMRHRLDAPVLVGVGAAFDFHAGLVPQAPDALQRLGLEWAFRLVAGAAAAVAALPALQPALRRRASRASTCDTCGAAGREEAGRRRWSRPPLVLAAPARADVYDDNPAAASRGPGDMVVLARGADGAIYERHVAPGGWTDWTSIGGQATSGPAIAAYGPAMHAFVVGTRRGRVRERPARRRLVGLALARRRGDLGARGGRPARDDDPRPRRARHGQRDPPPLLPAGRRMVGLGQPGRQPDQRADASTPRIPAC